MPDPDKSKEAAQATAKDIIICPQCNQWIDKNKTVCPYCHFILDG